jgi:hypothetical protein
MAEDRLYNIYIGGIMTDPYSVLGVSRDASDEEIKKAYRTLENIIRMPTSIIQTRIRLRKCLRLYSRHITR